MKLKTTFTPLFLALSVASGSHASAVLEELIVTAQKQSQSVQDVPIAITVLNGEAMEKKNIVSVAGLETQAPGLRIPQQDAGKTFITVRGVGSRKFDVGSEGSVGVFLDEVYMPRFSGADIGLLDLNSVEVLKGPQGTLFGRNTAAGAISITTARPTVEQEGYIEAGIANKDSYTVRAGISGAVSENLTMRLSAGQTEQGGFQENTLTGTTNDMETSALRLQADFTVSDSLNVLSTIQYTEREQSALLQKSIATSADGTFLPLFGTNDIVGPPPAPGAPPATAPRPFTADPNFHDAPRNHDGSFDNDALFVALRIEKELEDMSFTSITSYQDYESYTLTDFDGSEAQVGTNEFDENSDTFSQEFRVVGDNFLGGIYYYVDDVEANYHFDWEPESLQVFLNAALGLGYNTFVDNTPINVKTTSFAVFGEYRFDITDQLSLTLGGRYSEDEKDFELRGETSTPGLPIVVVPYAYADTTDWSSFDPKVSLVYELSYDVLTYFTYSEGYKSGGVQFTAVTETMARSVFDPEELAAYELGVKMDLLDRTLRLNASAFFYDYQDLQVQRVQPVNEVPPVSAALTQNAAESEIQGFEVDVNWLPAEGFDVRFAYAYLDTEYKNFGDFTGNSLPASPDNTLMLSLNYTTTVAGDWELSAGTDWTWTDDFKFDVTDDDPFTQQEAYTVGSLNLSVVSPDQHWTISAHVDNLTDEEYYKQMTRRSTEVIASPSDGRRYGVRVRYSF